MGKRKIVEYFEEVETNREYNGYFVVSRKQSALWYWKVYADCAT